MPNPFTIPGAPPELMQRINERRARIPASLTMMADDPDPAGDQQGEQTQGNEPKGDGDPLGAPGIEALRRERERADELDRQVKALQQQFSAIGEALGAKPKGKDEDALTTVQTALSDIRTELAVEKLARAHRITDEDDIATLAAVTNPEARAKLAARLAPAKDDEPKPKRKPAPDPSQGPKDASKARPDVKGVQRLASAFEEIDNTN